MSRVLLVGWDAADWKIAGPLIEAGEMPHLKSLIEGGVSGNVSTIQPAISPMLWTSIATGKRPAGHGIHGFYEPTPDGLNVRPVGSLGRRTKAVWNILNQNGKRSIVVGWWPSHPPEPIRGVMISNHFAPPPVDSGAEMPPGAVWPPRWSAPMRALRIHGSDVEEALLRRLAPGCECVDGDRDSAVQDLANIAAESLTIHRAATTLLESEPWDFAAVYYVGIDHFSHRFMRYHAGRISADRVLHDPDIFRATVRNAYRWHDEMLGSLMRLAGDDCAVMVVSDHGFHSDELLPDYIPPDGAGPAVEHRNFGVFCLKAPGSRKNVRIGKASVLDVAPTVLHLFGLPAGGDMDGRVLIEAFEDMRAEPPVPSWDDIPGEDGAHPPDRQYVGEDAAESVTQLVALGYVAPPGPDELLNVENCIVENRYNLARSLMDAGRCAEAASIFQDLVSKKPHQGRFYIHLFRCLSQQGDAAGMEALADRFDAACAEFAPWAQAELAERRGRRPDSDLQGGPGTKDTREIYERKQLNEIAGGFTRKRFAMRCQLAVLSAKRTGQTDDARAMLDALAEQVRGQRGADLFLARTFAVLGDADRALEFARRARTSDPDTWETMTVEAQIYSAAGRHTECVAAAEASLSLVYFQPKLHYIMGLSLARTGSEQRAANAFRTALAQMPTLTPARDALSGLAGPEEPAVLSTPRGSEEKSRPRSRDRETVVRGIAAKSDRSGVVTIVSGLPRSGTSMMMQMLAGGGIAPFADGIRIPDEDNPRGYYESERAINLHRDASWVPLARGKVVKIVAQLLPHLPPGEEYRIVFMQRELEDVVASQGVMLQRLGRSGAGLSGERLMRAYSQQLSAVRGWLGERSGIEVLWVRYSEALADPAGTAALLGKFLGEPFDEVRAAHAVEPSLRRQHRDNRLNAAHA
jgi:predicted AlkP superfamily phosphohydrolase/phosphomutase/Flp pilus assembly protein TadD